MVGTGVGEAHAVGVASVGGAGDLGGVGGCGGEGAEVHQGCGEQGGVGDGDEFAAEFTGAALYSTGFGLRTGFEAG